MAANGEENSEPGKLGFSLDVPFPSPREATIALSSLSPDREPRRGGISKHLSEVERRRSSDPASVRLLLPGPPAAGCGDHGEVWRPDSLRGNGLKPDTPSPKFCGRILKEERRGWDRSPAGPAFLMENIHLT
ncbi:L antigen family member 3-like isoform X1 [Oryzias latipes]